jgi:hypothetical protein
LSIFVKAFRFLKKILTDFCRFNNLADFNRFL